MVEHLTTLMERATVVPAVNQIECHPYFAQRTVQDFGSWHGILTQAWSPVGGITFYRDGNHNSTLDDPTVAAIATSHAKTPAQVILRSGVQHGRSVSPKSTRPSRIAENIAVFDFELSADEITAIDSLDTGRRGGPEPDAVTLGAFGRDIPAASKTPQRHVAKGTPSEVWVSEIHRASGSDGEDTGKSAPSRPPEGAE